MNLPDVYEEPSNRAPVVYEEQPFFRADDDRITLSYLVTMFRRRLPVFFLMLALCVLLAAVLTLAAPRIYSADAEVVLLTDQQELVPGDPAGEVNRRINDADVETRIQLIRSQEMAGLVYDELGLAQDESFAADLLSNRSIWGNLTGALGFGGDGAESTSVDTSPEARRERGINLLMSALDVSRINNSYTLQISAETVNPERSAAIANGYARVFTNDDLRRRSDRNEVASEVLGERLAELREQANADFAAVQAYRVRNDLLSTSATGLTEQEISSYNQQIASARAQAAQDAQSLATARSQLASGSGNVGQGTSSQVVANLRAQRAQLSTRETDLAQRYLERHPELVSVREQIAQIDRQIDAEVNREIRALEARASASQQRLNSLLASRSGTTSQLRGDNTALVALTDLEREAASSQALYESYLQRYNETLASSGAEQPDARLISSADVPFLPSSPNWPLMMALGIATGLALGVLAAIGTEMAYGGLTTLDDVEEKLHLNALGSLPLHTSIRPHGATPLDTMTEFPDGPYAESLRNLLVSIGRASSGRCEVIALTSAIPGEGKTTTAAALGRAIAMAHQSVVVVDCDLVRTQLSRMFDLNQGEAGLQEALAHPEAAITSYKEGESDMQILPITKQFPKGERLTEGGRLAHVINRLREQFDFVILDCPPILPIAEAREIAGLADHVVLVVRWRKTVSKIVNSAIRQLPRAVIARTGVALNRVDMRKQVRFGGSDAASFYKHYEAYYG